MIYKNAFLELCLITLLITILAIKIEFVNILNSEIEYSTIETLRNLIFDQLMIILYLRNQQ